ncbi:MAG: phage late control D family protein, partial [Oxalobacter sp.]|nr:phage late control D family protein [Oxalobacter sp.]
MNTVPVPAFRITFDGKDISPKMRPRLVSISLSENGEDEADQLDITLDDSDGQLALPSIGVTIHAVIGWKNGIMVDKGTFTVSGYSHAGAPDTLTVHARTADLTDNLKEVRERSYHQTTLGAIIDQIAKRNSLKSGIAQNLRARKIRHIDQTGESDAAFLRRLGKQFDAVATIKNGTLLFTLKSQSKTASGKDMDTVTITRKDGDSHNFNVDKRDEYTGVRAYWHDPKKARRKSVAAGLTRKCKNLKNTYASKEEAEEAAKAEWLRIQRGEFKFSMTLALGRPDLLPQSPVRVSGYKQLIDET